MFSSLQRSTFTAQPVSSILLNWAPHTTTLHCPSAQHCHDSSCSSLWSPTLPCRTARILRAPLSNERPAYTHRAKGQLAARSQLMMAELMIMMSFVLNIPPLNHGTQWPGFVRNSPTHYLILHLLFFLLTLKKGSVSDSFVTADSFPSSLFGER